MGFVDVLEELGVDPQETIRRFCQNETLLKKYLKKFSTEKTYDRLKNAVEILDYEEIEAAAHTLKGLSANLGMVKLSKLSEVMVNAIRERQYDNIGEMFEAVETEYKRIVDCLLKWEDEL